MLKLLIKINFTRMFAPRKRKNKQQIISKSATGMIIAYSVLAVSLMIGFGALASGIGIAARTAGTWFYCEVGSLIAFLMMFIGSVFYAVTSLYDSKDNELLLSMPIKPGDIVLARLTALLLLNAVFGVSVMLPFIGVGSFMGLLKWYNVLFTVLGTVLLIIAAMAVVCFISWIISLISSRVKHKQVAQVIMMLFAFALYMVIYPNIGNFVSFAMEEPDKVAAVMGRIYPFYAFGRGCEGDILMLLLFAAASLALGYLAYFLLQRNFIGVITRSKSGKKAVYKAGRTKVRGSHTALVYKEIRRFTQSAVYMFNAGLGLLLMIAFGIMMIVLKFNGIMSLEFGGFTLTDGIFSALMAAAVMFIASMTDISAPSVSLENRMLWILRSSPVSGKEVLTAKADAHLIISLPFLAVTSVLCAVALQDIPGGMLIFVAGAAGTAVIAHLGVIMNMLFPRFDVESDTQIIKQSGAVLFTMLIGFVYALAAAAVILVIGYIVNAYIAMICAAALSVAVAILLRLILAKPLARKFERFAA